MFIGLIVFVTTKKKNLGLAGTQVPNPLTPQERTKVFGRLSIGALVIIIIGYITITTGILTIQRFTMVVSLLGIIIPTCYFLCHVSEVRKQLR